MRSIKAKFEEIVKEPYHRSRTDNMPDCSELDKISDSDRIALGKYCREVKRGGKESITLKRFMDSEEGFTNEDLYKIWCAQVIVRIEHNDHRIPVSHQLVLAKLCHIYTNNNIISSSGGNNTITPYGDNNIFSSSGDNRLDSKYYKDSYSKLKDMINNRNIGETNEQNIGETNEQNKRKSRPYTEDSTVNKRTKVFEVSEMLNQSPILRSVKDFENNRKGGK